MPARGQDWREQINTAFISLQLIIVYNGHPYLYSTLFSSYSTGRVYFSLVLKKMSRNLHFRMLAYLHILYLKRNSEYAKIDILQLLCPRDRHFMFIESLFKECKSWWCAFVSFKFTLSLSGKLDTCLNFFVFLFFIFLRHYFFDFRIDKRLMRVAHRRISARKKLWKYHLWAKKQWI